MTRPQRIVLLAGIIVVAVMLLHPLWYRSGPGLFGEVRYYAGYRYINAPRHGGLRIDFVRWLWPVGVVGLITLLFVLELGGARRGGARNGGSSQAERPGSSPRRGY